MSDTDSETLTDSQGALTHDDLQRPFLEVCKPPQEWRVGIEAERIGLIAQRGEPIHYDGPAGILSLFEAFVEQYGWKPESEMPGGPVLSLHRGEAAITLEPGSQFELSGAPHHSLHALAAEVRDHARELHAVSEPLGIRWLGLGFHPLARQDQLGWVPKFRYGIMRVYLATRGTGAHDMMRRTATVQANFDYGSLDDAMRKLRVALRLSPLVSTIFANSPLVEGRPFGGKSYRMKVWLDVDPDRQGLLPTVWNENSTVNDYITWALDAPMFLIKRGDTFVENTGQTFRSFMNDGFGKHRATLSDWALHLNTLFPEVRLKRTLEVRGADSVPLALMPSLPALWTGLLYDDRALQEAEALSAGWRYDDVQRLRSQAAMEGLAASFEGSPLAGIAERVIDIARDGLMRRAILDESGQDERVHLAPIAALVERGRTPADDVLDGLQRPGPIHENLLASSPA